MNTRPDHHEPLDAEERDLAARLRRAGPLDGPSPALDAKILAAAHAAAATHKPRRHGRLAWLGVPPALVTGVGVAAAAVLALGLVWQLRPQYGGPAVQDEAAPASADEEVIIFAEPAATPRAQANNPPPLPAASAAAPEAASVARAARSAEADVAAAQARARADASAEASAKAAVDDRQKAEAALAQSAAQTAQAADAAAAPQAFSSEEAPAQASAEAPATAGMARKSHATYTTAARATAERREREHAAVADGVAADRAAAAAPAAPPLTTSAPAADSTTLDRIEVTGSRIRRSDLIDWSQVPITEDKALPTAEWLERIRARRDADDLDSARASLKLFRREYPRVRIPDDLRALLATDAKR